MNRKDSKKDIEKANLTTAHTDTETGNEGLSPEENRKKDLAALEIMYARGLVEEATYNARKKELEG